MCSRGRNELVRRGLRGPGAFTAPGPEEAGSFTPV